jgi:hypothetical protein
MKLFTSVRSLMLVLALLCTGVVPGCNDESEEAVRETFDRYMTARIAGDAATMQAMIDPENIKYYDHIVRMAREGTKLEVVRLRQLERLEVAILRSTMTAAQLKDMDGSKLFKMANEKKWERAVEDMPEISLGPITFNKPRATAELVVNGEGSTIQMEFVEVDHKWVVNNECMNQWISRWIKLISEITRTSEDSVLLSIASRRAGKTVRQSVWDEPPK